MTIPNNLELTNTTRKSIGNANGARRKFSRNSNAPQLNVNQPEKAPASPPAGVFCEKFRRKM